MTENTNNDELIEQYLLGELSGDLLVEFKKKLTADEKLRSEVALQRSIIRNLKAVGREDWAVTLETLHKNMPSPGQEREQEKKTAGPILPLKSSYQKKSFLFAAAAVIIIIFSTLFIVNLNKASRTETIFTAYYQPYPDLEPVTRSIAQGVSPVNKAAFTAYNAGNYLESIRLFNIVLENGEDEMALFYLGNACLSADKQAAAETNFKKYLSKYKEFATESKWYLSLSYVKQRKIDDAKKLLNELAAGNNNYNKKAREILIKL